MSSNKNEEELFENLIYHKGDIKKIYNENVENIEDKENNDDKENNKGKKINKEKKKNPRIDKKNKSHFISFYIKR